MKPPKGQILELEITDLSHDGKGVAHLDDFAIFIPGALEGEKVQVQISQVKKHYASGSLVEIIRASKARVKPTCRIYPRCGGCQIQHLGYSGQLAAKEKQVRAALGRIGKLQVPVLPIVGQKEPWHYRNKALLPFAYGSDSKVMLGCFQRGTHTVVDLDHCPIEHPNQKEALVKVKELVEEYGLSIYNEKTGKGLLRHLLIRTGFNTGESLVGLVTTGEPFPQEREFAQRLSALEGVVGVVRNINSKRTNVILGHETQLLWGRPVVYEEVLGLRFAISATSFFQVNTFGMELLYEKVLEAAGEFSLAVDAYSGIGSIALLLAQRCRQVYGIEIIPSAIVDAKANAKLNKFDHAIFLEGKVEEVLPQLLERGLAPDLVVLDPPRKGCEETVLTSIAKSQIPKLVYVSCSPSTLARDLALLAQRGYETKWVQPVDMFPQTYHTECVAKLVKML